MDYETLIENLVYWSKASHVNPRSRYALGKVANAITDLLARAEAAEARAEKAERALAHMWYAYENKDAEFPHEYEKEAVKEAEQLLGKWEDVMPKLLKEE